MGALLGSPLPRSPKLTPREREVLVFLATEEGDGDLVHSVLGGWWFGDQQLSGRVGYSLLRKCLVSRRWGEGDSSYYAINEEGRNALADPTYVPEIYRHLGERQAPSARSRD